jgi:hypothetical protein
MSAFAWVTPLGVNEGGEKTPPHCWDRTIEGEKPTPFTKTVKDAATKNLSRAEIVRVEAEITDIAVRAERKKALIRDSDQGPLVSTAD